MNIVMFYKFFIVFIVVLWVVLLLGVVVYLIGLFNVMMVFNEKGYYLILLLFGLFVVVLL